MVLAASTPTRSDPISPGPTVTATASIYSSTICLYGNDDISEFFVVCRKGDKASMRTGVIDLSCSRAATSGTIPPHFSCIEEDDATTLDIISVPSFTTAAAVSSHDVSTASMFTIPENYTLICDSFNSFQQTKTVETEQISAQSRAIEGPVESAINPKATEKNTKKTLPARETKEAAVARSVLVSPF